MSERHYSQLDRIILDFDRTLGGIFADRQTLLRGNPAASRAEIGLGDNELQVSRGLMRVNHAGEVSAQALYHAQALSARSTEVKQSMRQAAEEEEDHLQWCAERLKELQTHTSYLNPLWYSGSFGIGLAAGLLGDRWSLGFVAETERQVVAHLDEHLQRLPAADEKSRAIVEQMKTDEAEHASMAVDTGAAELPATVKRLMHLCSRVMTSTAYWF